MYREEALEDIQCFLEIYAPKATLSKINTEGNLQLRFMSFDWTYPNIGDIPEGIYHKIKIGQSGVSVTPDPNKIEGHRLIEEQLNLLSLASVDCFELWASEIAPLLNWEIPEEPWMIQDPEREIFILVTNKYEPHGMRETYRPPIGVVSIDKQRVNEIMGTVIQ